MKLKDIFEMASGKFSSNRLWYHATTKKGYDAIMKSGFLEPFVADDWSVGKVIWFSSNIEESKMFGNYIFQITNKNLEKFQHKKISPYPHGFKIKHGITDSSSYTAVVSERIPVKYLTVVKINK